MRLPNLIAEEICGVQPMANGLSEISFKIVKTRLVERERKLKGRWYVNWEECFYYTPYIPLGVHEYPEKKEFLKDEDILV
jgi:hypothetical protein